MGKKSRKGGARNKQKGGKKKVPIVKKEDVAPSAEHPDNAEPVLSPAQTAPSPALVVETPPIAKVETPPIVKIETPPIAKVEPPPIKEDPTPKSEPEPEIASALPPGLESSLHLLTEQQRALATALCTSADQSHLFSHWPAASKISSPSSEAVNKIKVRFMEQLMSMDDSYPSGGLLGYISNARILLDKCSRGENPLEGWTPSVPQGQDFGYPGADASFDEVEKIGVKELGRCGFVLVAGGLGERLGYGDIKVGLPTELSTETSYIQFYIEIILAYQKKYAVDDLKLPLCIMTSNDTNTKTVSLLEANNYFGMDKSQITIVQQGQGVPALVDNNAKMALDSGDKYKIMAKPHGHGDIHALMHSNKVAKTWLGDGLKWVVFLQDTNGLAFNIVPLALGVSSKLNLVMNSVAVPRKAKQAVGGIAKLTHKDGSQRTINVEYNQLDPLLQSSTAYPNGDENDPQTNLSPFPGNINQLVFELQGYVDTLKKTAGAMPEFVNPKYKDDTKTDFKKPTRLECMMQDFPTVLKGETAKRVGFTQVPADLCFSPVKNTAEDGMALQKKGTQAGVPATGEADQYNATRKILSSLGCQVDSAAPVTYNGIEFIPGPALVFKPSFVSCPAEYKVKFPSPSKVSISSRSSLVVQGENVIIESLELDGALVIECEEGATDIVIRDLVVTNDGWVLQLADPADSREIIRMRGYSLNKKETKTILVKKDGTVEGYSPMEKKEPAEIAPQSTPVIMEEPAEIAPKSTPVITEEPVSVEVSVDAPKPVLTPEKHPTPKVVSRDPPDLSSPSGDEEIIKNAECCVIS